MQGVVATSSELPVNGKQVLNSRYLRRDYDAVVTEPRLLGEGGGPQRALNHRFDVNFLRVERRRGARILVHEGRQEILVERTQWTPFLTACHWSSAIWMMVRKFSSRRFPPTLPGLMRYLSSTLAVAAYLASSR